MKSRTVEEMIIFQEDNESSESTSLMA